MFETSFTRLNGLFTKTSRSNFMFLISKFLTQNSVKNTGNFASFSWPTEALFERFRNFP